MPQKVQFVYHRCWQSFSSYSGLTRHQTYSKLCTVDINRDIIIDFKDKPRRLPFGFEEYSIRFPISDSIEPANNINLDDGYSDIATFTEDI